jgi:hypothetical protein
MIKPTVEQHALNNTDIDFYSLDVDAVGAVAESEGIRAVSALAILKYHPIAEAAIHARCPRSSSISMG